jgi:hypothetical protein
MGENFSGGAPFVFIAPQYADHLTAASLCALQIIRLI